MSDRILSGRYVLGDQIGSGGMAVVYLAWDKELGREVAVKILRSEYNEDQDFVRRFNLEAQAASKMSHENIVGIYGVGQDGDTRYIVMEYVRGRTLKEVIRQARAHQARAGGPDHPQDTGGGGLRPPFPRGAPGHQAPEHPGGRGGQHQGGGFRHRPGHQRLHPDLYRRQQRAGLGTLLLPGAGVGPGGRRKERPCIRWGWCSTRWSPERCPSTGRPPSRWP